MGKLAPRLVTDDQILEALEQHDDHRQKAAESLGITERSIYKRLSKMKGAGTYDGGVVSPTPDAHTIRGVSTLYGQDGSVRGQWVKTQAQQSDKEGALLQSVKDAFADHATVSPIKTPKRGAKHLLTCYPMGDPHIGMYAYSKEAGDDFDLEIAERQLVEATQRLVDCTPASESALIVNLGDFFHADNTENRTMKSGNILDVDTRWSKVLKTGVRIMRTCIESALTKHRSVKVINEIGNHDEHTSQMLTLALSMLYERNKRVTFDESPARFHYHEFGNTLIGITHGDTIKPDSLGGVMATDMAEAWGKSKHRYWFTGHVHNRRVFELPGCTVESFRTLAAKDAWHASKGYRSGRDMQAIVIDKDYGEVERHRVDISRLQ